MTTFTMRRAAPLPRSCRELMSGASRVLGQAIGAPRPAEKFAQAHLAALRAAAAVLAMRARPQRTAQASAWELLPRVAPELAEWAAFFAAGAQLRQRINAGVAVRVTEREADDLVRAAAEFLDVVDDALAGVSTR